MGRSKGNLSPSSSPSRSSGLEPLRRLDHIWIELLREATDPMKKFTVRDPAGQLLYYCGERMENFTGRGRGRRFHMTLLTPELREVVNIYRKEVTLWFGCFCNATCMEQLKVTTAGARERVLGTVDQVTKILPGVLLDLKNPRGTAELHLRGPKTNCTCCGFWSPRFKIEDSTGKEVGSIKQGLSTVFAHNFELSFPAKLDTKMKAVLLSVCFMVGCRSHDLPTNGYAVVTTMLATNVVNKNATNAGNINATNTGNMNEEEEQQQEPVILIEPVIDN